MVVRAGRFGVKPPVGRLERILRAAGYQLAAADVDAVSVTVGVEPADEGGGSVEECQIMHRVSLPNGRAPYSLYSNRPPRHFLDEILQLPAVHMPSVSVN